MAIEHLQRFGWDIYVDTNAMTYISPIWEEDEATMNKEPTNRLFIFDATIGGYV